MKKNFIITKDADKAKELFELGYKLISNNNNTWQFLNNEKQLFSNQDGIIYTDKLHI